MIDTAGFHKSVLFLCIHKKAENNGQVAIDK